MVFRNNVLIGAEKKPGESRVAITPKDARKLLDLGIEVALQSSNQRCWPDSVYGALGIPIVHDASQHRIVVATKEFNDELGSIKFAFPWRLLVAFHHVHKGQKHNLALLRHALTTHISLFDYELYRLADGTQPITTSRFAGIGGMVNGFITYGMTASARGGSSVFSALPKPGQFGTVEAARAMLETLLPVTEPIRVGIVGTGQCGRGAREVCEWLDLPFVSPDELLGSDVPSGPWFTVFETKDIVERISGGGYDRDEYRTHGATRYKSSFDRFIGKLDLLTFCPYWDESLPKLLPRELILSRRQDMPKVISDVTCDLDGSLACTLRECTIDNPIMTYDPLREICRTGIHSDGLVVTAVDYLPAQIAKSTSDCVSRALFAVLPALAGIDFDQPLEEQGLSSEILSGFITYRGVLRPQYAHLQQLV